MTNEGTFLVSLGQSLATMALYGEGHPARERAIDSSFDNLMMLTADRPSVKFSFLGNEAVCGDRPLAELGAWDWAAKLSSVGVERIEIDAEVSRDAYLRFIDDVWQQLSPMGPDTAEARQMVRQPIRFGRLRVRDEKAGPGEARRLDGEHETGSFGYANLSLTEEIETVDWVHEEIQRHAPIPLAEVEAVVRSLAVAMHAERQMLLPLLTLKRFDQYTTTHACNVAVLAMGLSERLGLSADEVRSFGVAGLLHDIGKVMIPIELLTKPGRFTDEERAIVQHHPADGAKIILQKEQGLGIAAVVAYEHHVFLNGQGYPSFRFPRSCHYASRIVHVCDVYDALCTDRPYRAAWEPDQALVYLEERAGIELDPDIVHPFTALIREALVHRITLEPTEGEVPGEAVLCGCEAAVPEATATPA